MCVTMWFGGVWDTRTIQFSLVWSYEIEIDGDARFRDGDVNDWTCKIDDVLDKDGRTYKWT